MQYADVCLVLLKLRWRFSSFSGDVTADGSVVIASVELMASLRVLAEPPERADGSQ